MERYELARRAKLVLTQAHTDFIGKMNDASVVTRYPDDFSEIVTQYPESVAREYFDKAKEVIAWIRQDPRLRTSEHGTVNNWARWAFALKG